MVEFLVPNQKTRGSIPPTRSNVKPVEPFGVVFGRKTERSCRRICRRTGQSGRSLMSDAVRVCREHAGYGTRRTRFDSSVSRSVSGAACGYSWKVKQDVANVQTRVQFPLPAPELVSVL